MRVVCNDMGGGFGSKNAAGDYTYIAAELARAHGEQPVKCALTRRDESIDAGNRNATSSRSCAPARARTARSTALEGEFIAALGWGGWHAARPPGR